MGVSILSLLSLHREPGDRIRGPRFSSTVWVLRKKIPLWHRLGTPKRSAGAVSSSERAKYPECGGGQDMGRVA